MKQLHSNPGWTGGPRGYHSKFGSGHVIGGIGPVDERLMLIKQRFPEDLTSGHVLHEFATSIKAYEDLNSPYAIGWEALERRIRNGDSPELAAITAPAFNLPGAQFGAILSPDEAVRQRAWDLHKEAIEKAMYFLEQGLGYGKAIWWPAGDSRLACFGGWDQAITPEDAWARLVDFWVRLLSETGGSVWKEWKPAVPGGLDYAPTPQAANAFCKEVNKQLNRVAMLRNDEWAHALIAGFSVERATRNCLEAGLFDGFVHVNSAQRATIRWDTEGKNILEGTPGEDFDWPVGFAHYCTEEIWADQQAAVKVIMSSVGDDEIVIFEHDIDPAGRDPLTVYKESRDNLEQMIAAAA